MRGFPYGTTAWYEDSASNTPVNFSVAWESRNWLGGVLSLFFGAKLLCNIFTFILTNAIKAAKLRKSVRSASYLTTEPRPLSLQLSKHWYLSTSIPLPRPQYLSPGWVLPGIFQMSPPPQYLSSGRAGTCCTLPVKTQDDQPILGDLRPRRDLPKFVLTPQAGGRVQGAPAGTKALVPLRVQVKEESPLWVPSWLP